MRTLIQTMCSSCSFLSIYFNNI